MFTVWSNSSSFFSRFWVLVLQLSVSTLSNFYEILPEQIDNGNKSPFLIMPLTAKKSALINSFVEKKGWNFDWNFSRIICAKKTFLWVKQETECQIKVFSSCTQKKISQGSMRWIVFITTHDYVSKLHECFLCSSVCFFFGWKISCGDKKLHQGLSLWVYCLLLRFILGA